MTEKPTPPAWRVAARQLAGTALTLLYLLATLTLIGLVVPAQISSKNDADVLAGIAWLVGWALLSMGTWLYYRALTVQQYRENTNRNTQPKE